MKNYDETINTVFDRMKEYEVEKKRKRKRNRKIVTSVSYFCLIVLVGATVFQGDRLNVVPLINKENIHNNSNGKDKEVNTILPSQTEEKDTISPDINETDNTQSPDQPENPNIPDNSESSEQSENPNTSDNSQNSEQLEYPQTSEELDGSNTPDNSQNSEQSDDPQLPDNSEQHEKPNNGGSGDKPDGIYTSKETEYALIRQLFGHEIISCSDANFENYELATVTQKETGYKEYIAVTYVFTNGTIQIVDQNRMSGHMYHAEYETFQRIEYEGNIFFITPYPPDENSIMIQYFLTEEKGLAYTAIFDVSMEPEDICALVSSLVIH